MAIFLVVVYYVVHILSIIILLRVIASWYVRSPNNIIFRILCWFTEPLLAPVRRFLRWFAGLLPLVIRRPLRWLGYFDFSPWVVLVLLQLIYVLLANSLL